MASNPSIVVGHIYTFHILTILMIETKTRAGGRGALAIDYLVAPSILAIVITILAEEPIFVLSLDMSNVISIENTNMRPSLRIIIFVKYML